MTLPMWFIIGATWFSILIVFNIGVHFLRQKMIHKYRAELSKDKKTRLINTHATTLRILKFFFWLAPLNLLAVPILIYLYAPTPYLTHFFVLTLLAYINAVQMFYLRRYIVNELQKED